MTRALLERGASMSAVNRAQLVETPRTRGVWKEDAHQLLATLALTVVSLDRDAKRGPPLTRPLNRMAYLSVTAPG